MKPISVRKNEYHKQVSPNVRKGGLSKCIHKNKMKTAIITIADIGNMSAIFLRIISLKRNTVCIVPKNK
jgi:hypothetical protein